MSNRLLFPSVVITAASFLLSACATPILNANTLDLASTVDDLAIRQIVFNLVKTHIDKESIPSQVQISTGSVTGKNTVTPQVTTPLNTALTVTDQVARQVAAAVTTTTTGSSATQRANTSGQASAAFEASQSWTIFPVQDPDQLRRLRLLYQYAVGAKTVGDLRCEYQVPEKKIDTGGSDSKEKKPAKAEKPAVEEIYVREGCKNWGYDRNRPRLVDWTQVGVNPDKLFLTQPGCVICIVPDGILTHGHYHVSPYVKEVLPLVRTRKKRHVWVDVNQGISPLSDASRCGDLAPRGSMGCVDWMFVATDTDILRKDAKRVGGHGTHGVYVRRGSVPEHRWGEYVLAIIEATLRSPEATKLGPPAPIVVAVPG